MCGQNFQGIFLTFQSSLSQGDAHPSQATSMTAFSNYAFVFNNLNRSKADCQGIATYCLYFVLSVGDYFRETGDAAGVAYLTPNVQDHLNQAVNMWQNPEGLRFVGWFVMLTSFFRYINQILIFLSFPLYSLKLFLLTI
jgi:hypothetical protein